MSGDSVTVDVIVLGAGFAGLGMAAGLRRAGRDDFLILERAQEVGGTWRDNTYPGCACDVPSHLYSFSFAPNPDWSRAYSPQPEILRYIQKVTDDLGLRPFIRFGVEVNDLRWIAEDGVWQLRDTTGGQYRARVVVAGLGPLNQLNYPDIQGAETFSGPAFHSGEWDHDVNLDGKRIGVIGTGASAIQFVPRIAPTADHLTLFQRTPAWVLPKQDHAITATAQDTYRRLPWLQRIKRGFIYARMESAALGFTVSPRIMKGVARLGERHVRSTVKDPVTAEALVPDYLPGCKRILISNDYYPTFNRENVTLVTDPIDQITPEGVNTRDGHHHRCDVLIYGTGFNAAEPLRTVKVTGAGGKSLHEAWKQGAEAYLGITVSGFPNLFLLTGPNTGLGHNSIIYMIESQVTYILDALRQMDERGAIWINVEAEAQRRFNDGIQADLRWTVWQSGCQSWYQTADGRNVTLWPGFTFRYRAKTRHLKPADYVFGKVADLTAG